MSEPASSDSSITGGETPVKGGLFPATAWSAISRARRADRAEAPEALKPLALAYWKPLYVYLRKRGENHEDASDSVQGFLAFVFTSGFFLHVEREGGRFRSYLLRSLERWRSRQARHENALKRGGNIQHVPLEELETMSRAELPGAESNAERSYDRQWAVEIVGRAIASVRADYARRDRTAWFETLRPSLPGGGGLSDYARLARDLGCQEGAVKKAVFDLRRAFAEQLRTEIRSTVTTAEEAEEELRYLITVFGEV